MKQKILYTLGGIGIGLLIAATFQEFAAKWQVTTGISLLITSIVLRYILEK